MVEIDGWRRTSAWLAWLGMAVLWVAPLSGQRLRLEQRVEAQSDFIRLGDIAQLDEQAGPLASIELGYSPLPGHYRWLSRSEVERALAREGWDPAKIVLTMPQRTLITRRSRIVEEDLIRSEVEEFVRRQWPEWGVSIDEMQAPSLLVLPLGDLELRISRPGRSASLGWVSLQLTPIVDGEALRSHWVRLRLSALRTLVVAARRLEAGRLIRTEDLEVSERRVETAGDFLASPGLAQGKVLRRPLNVGEPLRPADLQAAILVRRGELLLLQLDGRTFTLETNGRARKSGALGETIPVENLQTRKTVLARITSERTARVEVP